MLTDVSGTSVPKVRIKLPKDARPPMIISEEMHDRLLEYLVSRVAHDKSNADIRARRYARIDKQVSTWQSLTKEDGERKNKQESTGESQAININLPIQFTHIDDLVSFFAGVYAPNSGSFYEEPNDDSTDTPKRLAAIKKMNGDAKKNKYFKELCAAIRSTLKYNIGGLSVEWKAKNALAENEGSNRLRAIDMYNFYWDPSIDDPSEIPTCAEWSAIAERMNRINLIKGEQDGTYFGTGHVLQRMERDNGNIATFYHYPPNHAGLASDGADSVQAKGQRADWKSYGAGLPSEEMATSLLDNSHEILTVYCWLNPQQFRLKTTEAQIERNTLALFRFVILDAKRVISAELVNRDDENPQAELPPVIPHFVGFLNQDDMGQAQRSIAELLAPFQSYGSFLLNAQIAGSRGSIYGIQVYDPEVIDLKEIPAGSAAARIPSKKPGTDLRAALQTINGNPGTGVAMDDLGKLMALVDKFFPGQSMPSQIAGIDRAVQSQVAAVLQGVNRRLHMLVRIMDDDILGPTRHEQVANMIRVGMGDFTGLTEAEIMSMIGSGLAQLNRETAAQAMQQILFAVIQNPRSAEQYDVLGLMNYWSRMLNMDVDLKQFQLQPQQPAAQPGTQAPAATQPPPAGA